MSIKLSAASLSDDAGRTAARSRLSAPPTSRRASCISASAIFIAPIRRSISTTCSTRARPRLGDRRRRRARRRRGDARKAQGAGLADDGRRAGGATLSTAHVTGAMIDFLHARRCRGDPRHARRAGDPHRLADHHRGRLLHRAGDAGFRSAPSRHRRRRRAFRRAEDRVRPDPRRTEAPPRRGHRAVHRDVLRQHSGQRPRHRERRRRPGAS